MTACGHRVRFVASWREEFFEVPLNSDLTFLHKLKTALQRNGFEEVFVDTDPHTGIDVGDDFEARIYQAVVDCDLFLAVIGKEWIEILLILKEKADSGDRAASCTKFVPLFGTKRNSCRC